MLSDVAYYYHLFFFLSPCRLYLSLKKEMERMRDQQRFMREERDVSFQALIVCSRFSSVKILFTFCALLLHFLYQKDVEIYSKIVPRHWQSTRLRSHWYILGLDLFLYQQWMFEPVVLHCALWLSYSMSQVNLKNELMSSCTCEQIIASDQTQPTVSFKNNTNSILTQDYFCYLVPSLGFLYWMLFFV